MEGANHLKEAGVAHCDLKPENIIFTTQERKDVKIIDLGSACSETQKGFLYVCSRYYRAPEIVLGQAYSYPVDMWSIGCIIAELYNGQPIFPAVSQNDLMHYVTTIVGEVPKHMLARSKNAKLFFKQSSNDSNSLAVIKDSKSLNPGINKEESSVVKEIFMLKKRDRNTYDDTTRQLSRRMTD